MQRQNSTSSLIYLPQPCSAVARALAMAAGDPDWTFELIKLLPSNARSYIPKLCLGTAEEKWKGLIKIVIVYHSKLMKTHWRHIKSILHGRNKIFNLNNSILMIFNWNVPGNSSLFPKCLGTCASVPSAQGMQDRNNKSKGDILAGSLAVSQSLIFSP